MVLHIFLRDFLPLCDAPLSPLADGSVDGVRSPRRWHSILPSSLPHPPDPPPRSPDPDPSSLCFFGEESSSGNIGHGCSLHFSWSGGDRPNVGLAASFSSPSSHLEDFWLLRGLVVLDASFRLICDSWRPSPPFCQSGGCSRLFHVPCRSRLGVQNDNIASFLFICHSSPFGQTRLDNILSSRAFFVAFFSVALLRVASFRLGMWRRCLPFNPHLSPSISSLSSKKWGFCSLWHLLGVLPSWLCYAAARRL